MGDVISRQDTINEIKNVFDDILCCNVSVRKGLPEAVRRIEMMPSAEPKTGKWILPNEDLTDRPMAECDQCGWYVNPNHISEYNFCPNCGADMRGGKHE